MKNDDNYIALMNAEHTIRMLRHELATAHDRLRDICTEAQKTLDLTAGHSSDHAALQQWVAAAGLAWNRDYVYSVRYGICLASLDMIRLIGEVGEK